MFWFMRRCNPVLAELAGLQLFLNEWRSSTMAALDNLKREVQETKSVNLSVVTLLQGLKARLDEAIASNDPAELQALADSLEVEQQTLASAVTANTPAGVPDTPPL